MEKKMRQISIFSGLIIFLTALFLPVIKENQTSFSLGMLWWQSSTSSDFYGFWRGNFDSGLQMLVGSSILTVFGLNNFLVAVLLLFKKSAKWLIRVKPVLVAALILCLGYLPIFLTSPAALIFAAMGVVEYIVLKYLEGKEERDRAYAQQKAKEQKIKQEKKIRLAFKGRYPPLFKQIIRQNLRFYRSNTLILMAANFLSYLAVGLFIFCYRQFANGEESIFDTSGLVRILLESGAVLLLLLLIFLTFVNGIYLSFKAEHGELWFLLGIRRKTFLRLLVQEYALGILGAMLLGSLVLAPVIRLETGTYLLAIVFQLVLSSLTLAFQQDKILRLLQFKPKKISQETKVSRWSILWLLMGLAFLTVTFIWFSRRKSAETLLVFLSLSLGLVGTVYGGLALFVRAFSRIKKYLEHFLPFTDLFYQLAKNAKLIILLVLLQVFSLGFLVPRLVTSQMTETADLFPYDVVAKVKTTDLSKVQQKAQKYSAKLAAYPSFPVTSVDGDSTPESYGVSRPVMYIQGQHTGISETTYQELRKKIGLKKQPLNLKKGNWHVVYQQSLNIQAQPIDWDPGSKEPRLRLGTPLDNYDTLNIDQIFPLRQIQSQERLILTGMFQRGLQENLIVLRDDEVPTAQQNLVLIQTQQGEKLSNDLHFLAQKYHKERRWDETVKAYYSKAEELPKVRQENQLEQLIFSFLLIISSLLSVSLLLTKYLNEAPLLKQRQKLLFLLGMREKTRRQLLNRQLALFFWLPLLLSFILSLLFVGIMLWLRLFNSVELGGFSWRFGLSLLIYSGLWYLAYRFCGRKIMKWVKQ